MMWGGFGGGWIAVIGMSMMLVFWGTIIVLFIWGIRALSGGGTARVDPSAASPPASGAIEIVKVRYARGEITKDEYEALRRDLDT